MVEQVYLNAQAKNNFAEYYFLTEDYQESLKWVIEMRKDYLSAKSMNDSFVDSYNFTSEMLKTIYIKVGNDESTFDGWLEKIDSEME